MQGEQEGVQQGCRAQDGHRGVQGTWVYKVGKSLQEKMQEHKRVFNLVKVAIVRTSQRFDKDPRTTQLTG